MTTVHLEPLLRGTHRRTRRADVARAVMWVIGAVTAALLMVLVIDAGLGLGTGGLAVLDAMLCGVLAGGVGFVIYRGLCHRYDARRAAVVLEGRLDVDDNRLINAVTLAAEGGSLTSGALADAVVARGDALAGTMSPVSGVGRAALVRAMRVGGGAVGLMVLAYVLMPGVFGAVVPRLLDPGADHPPFTLIGFDVRVAPDRVMYGKPAEIAVSLSGPIAMPDRAAVVFVEGRRSGHRVPMKRRYPVASRSGVDSEDGADVATFVLRIDRATTSVEFYIDTPGGRSRRYRMDVHPIPLFESVEVAYRYPAYTGWPVRTHRLTSADLRALAGTVLTFEIQSNVALSGGRIHFEPDDVAEGGVEVLSIDPHDDDSTMARGALPVRASGRFVLTLIGRDGTLSESPVGGRVICEPDQPPTVWFDEPGAVVLAVEGWTVPTMVAARDDVGIDELDLQHRVNDRSAVRTVMERSADRPERAAAGHSLALNAMGAKAGDTVGYFATAYDNRSPTRQSADTAVQMLRVISMDEYLALARQQTRMADLAAEAQALGDRLDALGDQREALLEQLADGAEGATQEDQEDLIESLEAYAEEARELAADMRERADQPRLFDFEQPYQQALAETAEQLRGQAELAEALARAPMSDDAIARFAEMNEPFEGGLAAGEADLQRMAQADAMMEQADRIKRIIEQQRDLAERLAVYRDEERLDLSDQMRANRLAAEQAALREQLANATQRLRQLGEAAREELPKMSASAERLADAIDGLDVAADQSDAERLAFAGDGRGAHAAAAMAAEKLESLIGECEAMGGAAMGDLDGALSLSEQELAEAMRQMAAGWPRGLQGKTGGQGGGYQGESATVSVVGPRSFDGGESRASSRLGSPGDGEASGGTAGEHQDYSESQEINPETAEGSGGRAGVIYVVPARYRALTDAYFKRIADENE